LGGIPTPRYAAYLAFLDEVEEVLDNGIALYFPGPRSLTGEDVLELHGHGGPVVLDLLLRRVIRLGARLARPGEFTERAFLNGKIDLAQAEAIADLIDSGSEQAARSAARSLQGRFSERIRPLVEDLIGLRTYIEAGLDFPEDGIDLLSEGHLRERVSWVLGEIDQVIVAAQQGCLLREGMTVVIAGRPNVGKSTLLNALAEREAAIVTPLPGTTRDVLREIIYIDGLPVHVVDTAGLRESADLVEQEGIRRAWEEVRRADRILLVVEDMSGVGTEERALLIRLPASTPVTVVRTKIDITGRPPGVCEGELIPEVALSGKTGQGLEVLREHLKHCVGFQTAGESIFMARRRHLDALERARVHVKQAQYQLTPGGAAELLAEELRLAQLALGEITGAFTSEDLLERIFSSFCIGK
jgi:tRNA modification GTPase